MGARKPKKEEVTGFQKMIDRSPARQMMMEMENDNQRRAKESGISTDEMSIKRAKEKRRK